MRKSYLISYYVLWALLAATAIVVAWFALDGFDAGMQDGFTVPAHTDTLMYWMYAVLGICVAVTVVAGVVKFVSNFIDHPGTALESLTGVVIIAVILGITYSMASSEPVITGDGAYTDAGWLKVAGMMLYSIYFLMGAAIVAIIASGIKKAIS